MTNWHVLVVEDDPDGQEVVSRILRHHKITADVAATAEEAIGLLNSNQYNLAIIDLALPEADGWELMQSIKSMPDIAEMPCVAVTGFHSADLAVKAIKQGFAAYFPKPLDATSFVRELERVCS